MFDFAMIDIGLYLDVFPNDSNMIAVYNNFREEKKKVLEKYERGLIDKETMEKVIETGLEVL